MPYIGDESNSVVPAPSPAFTTAATAGTSSVSNVPDVPIPITGTCRLSACLGESGRVSMTSSLPTYCQTMEPDPVLAGLAEQHEELAEILDPLRDDDWALPTACEGWSVSDVVLHLAQTDEMALASLNGTLAEVAAQLSAGATGTTIDDFVGTMVENQRGETPHAVHDRWAASAAAMREGFASIDLSTRVPWVAGDLAARTLATTRLAEAWIHTGDVADALGVVRIPGARLQLIARLAWRTLPYAFARAGRKLSGPVAFVLAGPLGERWDFVPDPEPLTTIRGDALDLCLVAGRRADPAETGLTGEGPDAHAVLELVRTYA